MNADKKLSSLDKFGIWPNADKLARNADKIFPTLDKTGEKPKYYGIR